MKKEEIQSLRRKYGDAFYLLDSEKFIKNYSELKNAFLSIYPRFNIAYSYKTNYTPKLCKIVNGLGGYAEVVSEMELELALRIGVEPKNIIWNGPIKNPSVMARFLLLGGVVNVDSLDDLDLIKPIVKSNTYETIRLGIRVNYDVGDGVISRFGFDVLGEDFKECLSFLVNTPNIEFIGYQCHFAKRSLEFWPSRARGMLELIEKTGVLPPRIDLGGGIFGHMPDSLREQFDVSIPSFSAYAEAVSVLTNGFHDYSPELIIEPGSAIVGDCMSFVGTIKTIKCINGKWFATVLASQKNISMASVTPPIEIVSLNDEPQRIYEDIDLVGFTCIEGDVIYRHYSGALAKGDAIIISNCGSYSIVMKPPFILPNFPVIDIGAGGAELVKKGETFDDVFHTFVY